jgi:hypothetical protein
MTGIHGGRDQQFEQIGRQLDQIHTRIDTLKRDQ